MFLRTLHSRLRLYDKSFFLSALEPTKILRFVSPLAYNFCLASLFFNMAHMHIILYIVFRLEWIKSSHVIDDIFHMMIYRDYS